MENLIPQEEVNLIPEEVLTSSQSKGTAEHLSQLSVAAASFTDNPAIPHSVEMYQPAMETKEGEQRIRSTFGLSDQIDRDQNFNSFLTSRAMAGANHLEIAELIKNRQHLNDPDRSVLERRASEFLISAGLRSPERQAIVLAEELATPIVDRTKTDVMKDDMTVALAEKTLRHKLQDKFQERGYVPAAFEMISTLAVPFYTTWAQQSVVGRKEATLGGSMETFVEDYRAMSVNDRLNVLAKFEKDLESNVAFGGDLLMAMEQLDQLIKFKGEDAAWLNTTEALDATVVLSPFVKAAAKAATIYRAFVSTGAREAAKARAIALSEKNAAGKLLSPSEENEMVEAILPTIESLEEGGKTSAIVSTEKYIIVSKGLGSEKPTGGLVDALSDIEMNRAWENISPELSADIKNILPSLEDIEEGGRTGAFVSTDKYAMRIKLPVAPKKIENADDTVSTKAPIEKIFAPTDLIKALKQTVPSHILNAAEQDVANIEAVKELMKRFDIDPVVMAKVDPDAVTRGTVSARNHPIYDTQFDEGSKITTVHVYLGHGENKQSSFISKASAIAGAERMGLDPAFYSVSDRSGEFFIRVSKDVGSKKFINATKESELPFTIPWIGRYIQGSATLLTEDTKAGARLVTNAMSRLGKAVTQAVERIGKIGSKSKESYNSLLQEVQQTGKWKTSGQVDEWYRTNYSRSPSEAEMDAYVAHRQLHEFDYAVRDNQLRTWMATNGYEEVMVTGFSKDIFPGKVVKTTSVDPTYVRIFDTAEGKVKHHTAESLNKRLKTNDSTVLVKVMDTAKSKADYIITTLSDVQSRPPRHGLFGYRDGPHVMYDQRATGGFIKQSNPTLRNGQEVLLSPITHFSIGSAKEGKQFAKGYNFALEAYKVAKTTGTEMDIGIATAAINRFTRFSSFQEFDKLVTKGRILSTPFEFVRPGERVLGGRKDIPDIHYLDPDFANMPEGMLEAMQTGRLFTSKRGDRLQHPKEGLAALLDPTDILTRAISNTVNTAAFSNFKIREMDKWLKAYGKHIVYPTDRPDIERFIYGKFDQSLTPKDKLSMLVQDSAEAQRMALLRFMNNPGVLVTEGSKYRKDIASYIDGKGYTGAADKFDNVASSNFIGFARGAVFKTQFFMDASQLALQIGMWPGMMAISPKQGIKAFGMYPLIRSALVNPQHDMAIGAVANKLSLGSLKAEDFARMMQDIRKSGIDIINGNIAELDNIVGISAAQGMASKIANKGIEAGMVFYNEGEKANRTLGFTIAWLENHALTGKGLDSSDDFGRAGVRGNLISSNMNKDGKAYWQEGVFSIPAQFSGHTARVIEMFLHPSGLSVAERGRMYGALALTYGAGLGAGGGVAEYIKQKYFEANGKEISPELMRTLFGGLMGTIMPQTDVGRLTPFGQDFFLKAFLSDGFTLEEFLGPVGVTGNRLIDNTLGSAKMHSLITGAMDASQIVPTVGDITRDLLTTFASYNRAEKAIHSYQTGKYLSNKGQPLANNTDLLDSSMIAVGFPPLRSAEAFEAKLYLDDFKTKVNKDSKEAARYMIKAAQSGLGSAAANRDMVYFQYYRDLYVTNDHIGTGAQMFTENVWKYIKNDKAMTDEVFRQYLEYYGRVRRDLVKGK